MNYDDERIETGGGLGREQPRRDSQPARRPAAGAPDYNRGSMSYDEYMARGGDYDEEYAGRAQHRASDAARRSDSMRGARNAPRDEGAPRARRDAYSRVDSRPSAPRRKYDRRDYEQREYDRREYDRRDYSRREYDLRNYDRREYDRREYDRRGRDSRDYRRPASSQPRRRARRSNSTLIAALALVATLALVLIPITINSGLMSGGTGAFFSGLFGGAPDVEKPFEDVFATPTADPQATPTLAPTPTPSPEPTEEPGRVLDPNKKAIALTFDDGPSKYTDEILDVLEEVDGRATFFVVGQRIDDYAKRLQRAYDMGCQIGMHTYSHANLTKLSSSEIRSEIDRTQELIVKYTGEESHLVRPPYGSVNDKVKETVDIPLINWSLDTRDWESRDADSVYNEIMSNVVDGEIVLMHDLYASTAEAVRRVVPELVEQGYQLCTVDELFELKGITLHSGTVFRSAKQTSDS